MEIETLKAMNEGMYPGLLTMLEALALITVFFAIAGIAISLISIAWLCFEETRQAARRQRKPAASEPEEYAVLVGRGAPDGDPADNLAAHPAL